MKGRDFLIQSFLDGAAFVELNPKVPEQVAGWRYAFEQTDLDSTTFGVILDGEADIEAGHSTHKLSVGCYFCAVGPFTIKNGGGLTIQVPSYLGIASTGGPVERLGRLKYIDGCTDTLLISPPRWGDPCLNSLHFPCSTLQTFHTHPSVRIGAVLRGKGYCETNGGQYELSPGQIFCIPPESQHRFRTYDCELVVVAYHPDSDFGPLDHDHPMLNRTIIDGESASKFTEIQTR